VSGTGDRIAGRPGDLPGRRRPGHGRPAPWGGSSGGRGARGPVAPPTAARAGRRWCARKRP